jgi:hypothetical protein
MEGAGGWLLLAGAHATGLVATLERAVATARARAGSRLAHHRPQTRCGLVRTLLFLRVVGLRRPWDLRGYSGEGLAVLSGRRQAYGYRTVARFLREVAAAGGAQTLTDALGQWTTQVWQPQRPRVAGTPPSFYIDGHRKAVYSDVLVPRGLVGRRGAVLGCRALILLHDADGHPLFVTTHRGDLHLTVGVPEFLARYEAHNPALGGFIIDREGMAAEFLAQLTQAGRQVVTLLRRDQYADLSSFSDVGPFVPWRYDRRGRLIQEVAAARYRLKRPDHPAEALDLSVALVRDLRPRRPAPPPSERDDDLELALRHSGPLPPVLPRLLPIVVTAPVADPVPLAAAYLRRWPAQENSLKDFLLPLGLDTNHGYGKTPVVNAENAKRRAAVARRLAALQRGAAAARRRAVQALHVYARQATLTQHCLGHAYGALNRHRAQRSAAPPTVEQRTALDQARSLEAQAALHWAYAARTWARQRHETAKAQRYERDGRRFQQYLDELIAHERPMFELDNAQDQIMSVCTLALTNLVLWVRDQYFPAHYRQATWARLAPFFRLPGRITLSPTTVHVALRPFNDRALTRDLALLCEQVGALRPCLPDGRTLIVSIASVDRPLLDEQPEEVA